MENNIDVSIVIVCMNNLKNLYPCLMSIRKYTTVVMYETFVVAYLFSQDNLEKVKRDFPWVTFIESNEIRGFSENNNLALRQARGRYCFVLNDDTEMRMPVIDKLLTSIEKQSDNVAAMSPKSLNADGSFQTCGRIVNTPLTYVLSRLHLYNERKIISKRINARGVLESGDLLGAFFLIKTDLFRKIGFFDEKYFFSPEDLVVSFKLRKLGYKCMVDSDVEIVHYEGMTSGKSISFTQTATAPAGQKGSLIFYSRDNALLYIIIVISVLINLVPAALYHLMKGWLNKKPNSDQILGIAKMNSMYACFSRKTPKQLFVKFYTKLHE